MQEPKQVYVIIASAGNQTYPNGIVWDDEPGNFLAEAKEMAREMFDEISHLHKPEVYVFTVDDNGEAETHLDPVFWITDY